MERYDRNEVLAKVDLADLFTELMAPPTGRASSAKWPCPNPHHKQTGKTPPVSVSIGKSGEGLWHCHGCGTGGTAIDLLVAKGLGVGDAIADLARRVGVSPVEDRSGAGRARLRPSVSPWPTVSPPAETSPEAGDALEAYVATCADRLWQPEGAEALAWLRGRGFDDDVLRMARVGADPGPGALSRADGLPHGQGVVFPALDDTGRAVYLQLRRLDDSDRKYDNPKKEVFGPNPRLALIPPLDGASIDSVVVCEGVPDALTVTGAGFLAVAVLGAGYSDETLARALVERFPTEALVVAFDGDDRGRDGADRLAELLAAAGAGSRVWRLDVADDVHEDPAERDLNTWARVAGDDFYAQFAEAWKSAIPAGWTPLPSAADRWADFLATLADVEGAVAVPTGIAALNTVLANGGWRPGVVLVGGVTGIGKSAFGLFTALHAAKQGHPALYVSVEQSPQDLMGRAVCSGTQRPIAEYWNRSPSYLAAAREVADELPLSNWYPLDDPFLTVDEEGTVARLRRWVAQLIAQTGQIPLVIVDYLQRLRPPEADRRLDHHRQVSQAGLGLAQLARDFGCPVLAISSVNRQSYDKAPSLDAFKGSGDLEYDADACLLLRLAASDDQEAAKLERSPGVVPVRLHLLKNRYGPTLVDDPVELDFDRRYGGFRERSSGRLRSAG